jgi:Mn2+/Fe2+ NRAMP family transporter
MEDLIPIFSGVLGEAGRVFLGLTIWSMVFSNYVGYGTGYGLMIAEAYHRFVRPSAVIAEQDHGTGASYLPAFRWIVIYVLLCPLYVFLTDWSPVGLVIVGGAASALSLPIVSLVILRLTADPKIMGAHTNSWLTNIVLVLAGVGALYLGYKGILQLWPAVRGS